MEFQSGLHSTILQLNGAARRCSPWTRTKPVNVLPMQPVHMENQPWIQQENHGIMKEYRTGIYRRTNRGKTMNDECQSYPNKITSHHRIWCVMKKPIFALYLCLSRNPLPSQWKLKRNSYSRFNSNSLEPQSSSELNTCNVGSVHVRLPSKKMNYPVPSNAGRKRVAIIVHERYDWRWRFWTKSTKIKDPTSRWKIKVASWKYSSVPCDSELVQNLHTIKNIRGAPSNKKPCNSFSWYLAGIERHRSIPRTILESFEWRVFRDFVVSKIQEFAQMTRNRTNNERSRTWNLHDGP